MKRIVRLTESDLARIVRRVISEETEMNLVEKPKVGDIIDIYKKKDVDVNFHGSVCKIIGNYLYLKSTSDEKCIEYLWIPEGLKVTKYSNSYDVIDPTFYAVEKDCMTYCKK